jgi:septin family protein
MRPIRTPVNILVAGGSGLGKSSFIKTFAEGLGAEYTHAADSHTWSDAVPDRFSAGLSSGFKSFQEKPETWVTKLEPIEVPEAARELVYSFQVRSNVFTPDYASGIWTLIL